MVYHTDGLGSVRAITETTSPNALVIQTYRTAEFGIPDPSGTMGASTQSLQYTGEQRVWLSDVRSAIKLPRARKWLTDNIYWNAILRNTISLTGAADLPQACINVPPMEGLQFACEVTTGAVVVKVAIAAGSIAVEVLPTGPQPSPRTACPSDGYGSLGPRSPAPWDSRANKFMTYCT